MVAGTITIGTALAGGGQVGSAIHQREQLKSAERKSRRAQAKANRLQKAKTSIERARARRRAVSDARVAQARNAALATQQGISGSSVLEGAQSSIASNLATNIASANRSFVSGQATFDLRQRAADAQATGQRRAQTTGAVGNLFGTAASVGSSFI